MKKLKYVFVLALAFIALSSFTGKPVEKSTVYAFGFSASFSDSIVYFTEIQPLNGIKLEKKTNYLENRSGYSYQMKSYLEDNVGMKNRTCVVFYAPKKADAEKKYIKLRKRYTSLTNMQVKYLNQAEFTFNKIEDEVEQPTQE